MNYTLEAVHVTDIRPGDTIVRGGELKTVCTNNIKNDPFMGVSIFGDTYKAGRELVQRADLTRAAPMPSLATLEQIRDADHAAMHAALRMDRAALESTEAGTERVRECYSRPSTCDLRMRVLNALARTHGVETVRTKANEAADYLNTGDTYAPTVILWRGRYRVQSLGDFVETMERAGVRFV